VVCFYLTYLLVVLLPVDDSLVLDVLDHLLQVLNLVRTAPGLRPLLLNLSLSRHEHGLHQRQHALQVPDRGFLVPFQHFLLGVDEQPDVHGLVRRLHLHHCVRQRLGTALKELVKQVRLFLLLKALLHHCRYV